MLTWQAKRASILSGGATPWSIPDSCVGWWYGDSLTGGKWTDRSGNNGHMSLSGVTVSADGVIIDSINDRAYVNDADIYDIAGNLTVSAWVYVTTPNPLDSGSIVSKYIGATGLQRSWIINVSQEFVPRFGVSSNGISGQGVEASAIDPNTWTHIACVFVPSTSMTIYVDGVPAVKTTDVPAEIHSGTAPIQVNQGWSTSSTGLTAARIDDVMIFSEALSADDIAAIRINSGGSHT